MKKLLFIGLLLASSLVCYAQKTDSLKTSIQENAEAIDHGGNNEVKFNLLNAITAKPEITYERIVKNNMGVGVALFVNLDNSSVYKFGFTSYYRLYFGKKKASGFFIEGNTGIITLEDEYYVDAAHTNKVISTNLVLGAAAGAKYLTRNRFFVEAYVGGGKLIADRIGYSIQDFPRIGISIGKWF